MDTEAGQHREAIGTKKMSDEYTTLSVVVWTDEWKAILKQRCAEHSNETLGN